MDSERPKSKWTPKKRRFVAEYFAHDMNATRAAIAAGFSEKTAYSAAHRLLKDVDIKGAIADHLAEINDKAELKATDIMIMLKDRATADVRELIEIRRDCCRYCHGIDHQYQETPSERKKRKDVHNDMLRATPESMWKNLAAFDEGGGLGFDPRKDPNPDCPECFGRGVESVIPKDSRTLSRRALAIYEGVKISSGGGLEIKSASRERALDRLAQINGMFGKTDEGSGDMSVKVTGGLPEAPEADA